MAKSEEKVFCPLPWTHTCVQPWGVTLCCSSPDDMRISSGETLKETIQNKKYSEVRSAFIKGEWPKQCGICRHAENLGQQSHRMRSMRDPRFDHELQNISKQGLEIEHLELSFDSLCNLKCRMCSPIYSKKWREDLSGLRDDAEISSIYDVELKDIDIKDGFLESILPLLGSLKRLTIKGGEPTLNKRLPEFFLMLIEKGIAQQCHLAVVTNGTVFNEVFFKTAKFFANAEMIVSVDGPDPYQQYIRSGSFTLQDVKKNVEKMLALGLRVSFSTTFQIFNMLTYPKIFDELSRYSDVFFVSVVRTYGFCAFSAPDELREKSLKELNRARYKYKKNSWITAVLEETISVLYDGQFDERSWEYSKRLTLKLDKIRNTDLRKVDPVVASYLYAENSIQANPIETVGLQQNSATT